MDAESFLTDRGDEGAVDEGEKRVVGKAGLGEKGRAGHGHAVETGHFHDLPLRLSQLAIDRFLDELMDVPPNLRGSRRAGRRPDELKKQWMASHGPTCVGEILAPRLSGKDLGEFGRIEATELDFLHRASQDDVPSIVEGDGPAGHAEDMDVGNLDDDILERSKEREQLRPGIVDVVEDQERAASSHVLSEDLDRLGEVSTHQNGTQTGLAQRNQKIAERGEHGLWSVPCAHAMPKQIPLRAEQFTSPCSEGCLADSRHASHYEEASALHLRDGTEVLLATDAPLDR